MTRRPAFAARRRVDSLLKQQPPFGDDAEALSHWAKYLCVIVAGHIEDSVRHALVQYAITKADPRVARYVSSALKRLTNLNAEKIRQSLGAFDTSWGEDIKSFMAADERAGAIGSIMANRHLIAHGRDSEITLARLREWFGPVSQVLDEIARICA